MNRTYAIALNTFREAIRNRVFASLILFAIGMMGLTLAVSSASLNEEIRLMKDVGLFLTSLFSVVIGVFVGVNLVYKEIERKTIYTVVPKPIWRFEFLLGKYLGLGATLAVQVLIMGLVLRGQFAILDARFGGEMVAALWLIYVEVLVVMAVALFFSAFSTPFLSGLLTLGVFVVGRFVDRLLILQPMSRPGEESAFLDAMAHLGRAIAHVAPDLSQFNVTPHVVYEAAVGRELLVSATAYGLTYAAVTLVFASLMFSRRDFV